MNIRNTLADIMPFFIILHEKENFAPWNLAPVKEA